MRTTRHHNLLLGLVAGAVAACGSTVNIDVQIVDPCNQDAVQNMTYLKLEPRGEGIDSAGLSTIVEVAQGTSGEAIRIPLAGDFHLVAAGYEDDSFDEALGIGFSAKRDLSNADGDVEVRVPFALVDSFYKTTRLDESGECTKLANARYGATATYLPNSGKVLIVGGAKLENNNGVPSLQYIRLLELYDPDSGEFRDVGELRTGGARAFHTATLLSDDGVVLIAGGEAHVMGAPESLRSALIIDATDPTSVQIAESGILMRQARSGHIATRLADGRILFAGGRALAQSTPVTYLNSVEIFDPASGSFTSPVDGNGNVVNMQSERYGHTGFTLASGFGVAVFGGMNSAGPVLSIEVLQLDDEVMTAKTSAETVGVGPIFHAGDVTDRGEVLITGGYNTVADAEPQSGLPLNPSSSAEMYTFDNTSGEMRRICTAAMSAPRGYHTVSIVNRNVVVVGGRGADGLPVPSSETTTFVARDGSPCFSRAPVLHQMTDARAQHAVAKLRMSGELLVVGGRQQAMAEQFGRSIDSVEVFSPKREP